MSTISSLITSVLIICFRFGFRSKRGTVNALLCATHDWHRYLEMGKDVCVVFFDFAKAFDSVPHQALVE